MHYRVGRSRFSECDDDDVQSLFRCHDIVCLVETHCSYNESIDIEHYSVVNTSGLKQPKLSNIVVD